MKALTLLQPWASLVAAGIKRIETRSWQTEYRGPLAIHASARYPRTARALAATPAFRWALRYCRSPQLPLGAVLCTVELVQVRMAKGTPPAKGALKIWEWDEKEARLA